MTGSSTIEIENLDVRTDLIVENLESGELSPQDGIKVNEYTTDNYRVTEVEVPEKDAERIGKKPGTYITIDTSAIIHPDHDALLKLQKLIANIIHRFLQKYGITDDALGMVVGLGNDDVTPDALGPLVVRKIFVTNHLFALHPESISEEDFRPITAIAPSVMGSTGIETYEIINALVQTVNPSFLIVVDALASKSIRRVNRTIQISDAGISPGSGVGNKRKEISRDTVNIPVISIGVPTVVDAVTITHDVIDMLLKHLSYHLKNTRASSKIIPAASERIANIEEVEPLSEELTAELLGKIGLMTNEEKRQLIREVLTPQGLNMMVTPKEIDQDIEDLAQIIARGINLAMHKGIE